jgi:hypothetical protein
MGAAIAALSSVPVALSIWWTNARGDAFAAIVLSFDLWFLLTVLLLLLVLITDVLLRTLATVRNDALAGACFLYFLLWFVRMERAHQPFSIELHISFAGLFALFAIVVATAGVFAIGIRRSPFAAFAAAIVLGALLEILAHWQTPSRSRNDAIGMISAQLRDSRPASVHAKSRRVLFIGIDGMDWRSVAALLRARRLPAVEALLKNGRFYQLDNLEMRTSPEIWSAMHTGIGGPEHGIDSYLRWHFGGVRTSVIALPKFGFHSVWFLDRLLMKLQFLRLWSAEQVTNRDLRAIPDWAILSQSGKRVIAIDPLPILLAPERLSGSFVIEDGHSVRDYSETGSALHRVPSYPPSVSGYIRRSMTRTPIFAKLLRRERYDVAIVYTNFLDGAQHMGWRFKHPDGCIVCGDADPQAAFSAEFASSKLADAYVEADRTIAMLIDAFGHDATVILASDHGWEYDDYEHFARPYGMLIVANAGAVGYGGMASVRQVAPTILVLAGIPPDERMIAALDVAGRARPSRRYPDRREFIAPTAGEEEKLRELRSLGYIGN